MDDRKRKAVSEPIYLVEVNHSNSEDYMKQFIVMGTRGNEYKVNIKKNSSCTCMDYILKHKKDPKHMCKHIYFIVKRVLKCSDEIFNKKVFTRPILEELFSQIDNIPQNALYQPGENLSQSGAKATRKQIGEEDSCPICLEELLDGNQLIFCMLSCGNHIHNICFDMWCKKKGEKTCVYCRSSWSHQSSLSKEDTLREINKALNPDSVEEKKEPEIALEENSNLQKEYSRKPREPKNSYEIFTINVKEKVESKGFKGKKLTSEISDLFKNLSQDLKEKLTKIEEKDKERYEKEIYFFKNKGYYFIEEVNYTVDELNTAEENEVKNEDMEENTLLHKIAEKKGKWKGKGKGKGKGKEKEKEVKVAEKIKKQEKTKEIRKAKGKLKAK